MTPAELVGANIRYWRQANSLSQAQLANRLGISQPYVSQLEQGLKNPHVLTLARFASSMGVQVQDLFADTGKKVA